MVEVKKIAYEDRARYYVDPDFTKTPLERLLSKEYASERLRLFDPKRAARADPGRRCRAAQPATRPTSRWWTRIATPCR